MTTSASVARFDADGIEHVRLLDPLIRRKAWSNPAMAKAPMASAVSTTGQPDRYGRDIVITTEHIDRDGDIVRAAGLDVTEYLANPIVLLQHARADVAGYPVIGGNAVLERTVVNGVPGWICKEFLFADTALGWEIKRLWDDMILRTASIGFRPSEYYPIDKDGARLDPTDSREMAKMRGLEFARSALSEWSIVMVPANPNAARKLASATVTKASAYLDLGAVRTTAAEVEAAESAQPQDISRLLKSVTLERCPGCGGVVPHIGGSSELVYHRDVSGSVCPTRTIDRQPAGPSLKTIADAIRDTTRADSAHGRSLPAEAAEIARLLVIAADLKSITSDAARARDIAAEWIKAGRVLSAETRTIIGGVLQEVEDAAANQAEATDAIRRAVGALREFLAVADRPTDPEPKAPGKGQSAVHIDGDAVLAAALSDPRVIAAAARVAAA